MPSFGDTNSVVTFIGESGDRGAGIVQVGDDMVLMWRMREALNKMWSF